MDGSKNATTRPDSTTNEHKGASTGPKQSEHRIKLPAGFKDGSSLPKALLLQKNSKNGHNCTSASTGVVGVAEGKRSNPTLLEICSSRIEDVFPLDASTSPDVRPRSGGRPLEIRISDVESSGGQGRPRQFLLQNTNFDVMQGRPRQFLLQPQAYNPKQKLVRMSLYASNICTPQILYCTHIKVHSGKPGPTAPTNNQQDALEGAPSYSLSRTAESSSSNQQFLVDENTSFGSSGITESRPTTGENICRICHEGDQVESLISPCMCRGTLSLVHRTCLQHWLAESDSSNCELCRFRYITKRVPKYSLFGSFIAWLKLNSRQRKALVMDSLSIIAFIPFATLITYVAADLADGIEYQDSPTFFDVTIRFGIVSLISMMTTIDVAFATWGILRAQHHFATWYSWYRRNSDVTLIPHINTPTN